MHERVVISIDCSTTACKAIAWNPQGQALAEGRAAYTQCDHKQDGRNKTPRTGGPVRAWPFENVLNNLSVAGIDPAQIDALGITHQRETFVPVDAECRPLRNAILWLDERSRTQLEWLDATFGADALHELTGKPPSMTQSLPKIVWLLQNEPDVIHASRQTPRRTCVSRMASYWSTTNKPRLSRSHGAHRHAGGPLGNGPHPGTGAANRSIRRDRAAWQRHRRNDHRRCTSHRLACQACPSSQVQETANAPVWAPMQWATAAPI